MIRLSTQQRRWRLARQHRLTPAGRVDDIVRISEDLVGLHASDPASVHLSALVRMKHPLIAAVEQALYQDRSVVRHHAMRRTMWVMTPAIARLTHGAATAKIARAERKRTIAAMVDSTDIEDPAAWLDAAKTEIVALLNDQGPLTSRAIGQALPHLVVPLQFGVRTKHPAPINAHTKVLQGAGFDATLLRTLPAGTWISSEYHWTATETWLGESIAGLHEDDAAPQILERWLRRFGPASETDIKWWFGWTATLTRKTLAAVAAAEVELATSTGYVLPDDSELVSDPGPWVRLLPGLDPTVMGWKERDWYIAPELVPRLFDQNGNAGPTVWVDGEVIGGWAQRANGEIAIELSTSLSATHRSLLDDAINELSAAIGDTVVRPRFPAPLQRDLFDS